jgi:hypothetical protein
MAYVYDGQQLSAKTDEGARRQACKLIADGKARPRCKIEFWRNADGCHTWFELVNCPHCNQPLDHAALRKALNSDAARKKRPGAHGLVRNPAGRPKTKKPSP